jgi:hypothetical protein
MLAKRLTRRGLVLSAGSLTGVLAHDAASGCVRASLMISTVKAAMPFAARQAAAAGLISLEVAALTKGVLTAMLLSKVKVAMAALLAAAVVISSSGILITRAASLGDPESKPPASNQNAQERKVATPTAASDKRDKIAANPSDVLATYQNNAALFDELFNGKRVTVTGKVSRITGGGAIEWVDKKTGQKKLRFPPGAINAYYLEMPCERSEYNPPPIIRFQFDLADRKQLAKVNSGQSVTIEGEPGRADNGTFQFFNCKIIKPKADE